MNANVIEPIAAKGIGTENQEGDITMKEPVYTFRTLKGTDCFRMFKIVSKIGINQFMGSFEGDHMKGLLNLVRGKGTVNANTIVGISVFLEIANVVMGNLEKCEDDIYQLMADTSNLTTDQVRDLDFVTFTSMVIDFIKKPEFKDFIGVVLRSFK